MNGFLGRMTEIFKALSDPTRLRIIRYTAEKNQKLCVAEIAGKIGISVSAVSQHLKVLRHAGIVGFEKKGNLVYYFVNEGAIKGFNKDIKKLMDMVFIPCEESKNCEECQKREECGK
jgi:ArsR family transcriptional regulator, arsenate/arsenite/antimonite-responsive transcriptional repressor